jgi:hypothetical protein
VQVLIFVQSPLVWKISYHQELNFESTVHIKCLMTFPVAFSWSGW